VPTRNVVLTTQQDALVDELIGEGRYKSASEVLRDGLRLLADSRDRSKAELDDIRGGILIGMEQAERGEFAPGTGEEAIRAAFQDARSATGT
jgi:antitoxin ParD1/3/4